MPLVSIKLVRDENLTAENKAKVIAGVTDLMQTILHKDPARTTVIIEEVDADNWGSSGVTVSFRRSQER